MINEKSSFDSILFKKNSGNGIEPPIFDDDIIHRYNHFLVFLVFFFGSKFHDFVLIFFFYLFSYLCHSAPQVAFPSGPRVYSCYLCLSKPKFHLILFNIRLRERQVADFGISIVLPCLTTCIKPLLFIYSDLPTVMYRI